jgi:hypothetical protein
MVFKVGDRVKYQRYREVTEDPVEDGDASIGAACNPLLCSLCVAAADGVAFASFKCTTCNDDMLYCTPHQQLHMNSVRFAGHVFEKIAAPIRQPGLLESQQHLSDLKWHDKGFEAIVTFVGHENDAIILMKAGPKKETKLLVRNNDITLLNQTNDIAQSVFFESRSSANMAKIREFLIKIYGGDSINPRFVSAIKNFQERKEKDGSEGFWNDHHIFMLQDDEYEEELDTMLGSTTGKRFGKDFRLLCLDAVHKKVIHGPNAANDSEIQAAAKFCRDKQATQDRMPRGTITKCQQWWLRHRNVALDRNTLQRKVKAIIDAENPDIKRSSGPKPHMSDMTFAKHVVPIMRSTGNLLAPLSTWRRVMSAVHLLEQGLVDVELQPDGKVHIEGNADLVKEVWRGALDADIEWPKDDRTAKEYLERFGLRERAGEELGLHRLAVDAECVEDVFDTLDDRIKELGITKNTNILLTDELREHKDFERVKDALKVVADSESKRSFVTALERITAGGTAVPVADLLGNDTLLQFVCVDTTGPNRVDPELVTEACRQAGYTCRILVSYSDTELGIHRHQ